MNYRKLGRTGWMVSEIGYGMWGMGGWTGSDDAESQDSHAPHTVTDLTDHPAGTSQFAVIHNGFSS